MNFKELDVWQRAVRLSAEVYVGSRGVKDYGFRDQLTRSGLSVPSNIAEGLARISDRETLQFLSIARGSAAELETQLLIGAQIGYLSQQQASHWQREINAIQAMIAGLIKRYRRTIAGRRASHSEAAIDESSISESKISESSINESSIDDSKIGDSKIASPTIDDSKIGDSKIACPKIGDSNNKQRTRESV